MGTHVEVPAIGNGLPPKQGQDAALVRDYRDAFELD